MVVRNTDMDDALESLNKKTNQIREQFEKCYVRGNENVEFKEQFMKKQNEVEALFISVEKGQDVKAVSKILADIGKELRALEKLFSVSSMFVLPQVHGLCDDLIWLFEDRLTLLKKYHMVNKRVKEIEKPPTKSSNINKNNNNTIVANRINNTINNNNSNNLTTKNGSVMHKNNVVNSVAPSRNQNTTKYIRNTKHIGPLKAMNYVNDRPYTLENLSGVALALTERVINSKKVLLTGLTSCSVKIGFNLESLKILFCKYCQIIVGQVTTSFIKNTHNSLISINGEKLRIEYCESTIFKIPIKSNAIVKESYNLEFAQYENEPEKKKSTKQELPKQEEQSGEDISTIANTEKDNVFNPNVDICSNIKQISGSDYYAMNSDEPQESNEGTTH